jgi:hypothetical protein
MTDPRGIHTVTAGGESYRLHLGMSVLADLQARHGQDVLQRLEPPPGAGPAWMPDLQIVVDLILGALMRHHADVADRYLVDDIIAENAGIFGDVMAAAFPDQKAAQPGNAKRPKRAA